MEPLAGDDPRQVGTYRLHARLGAGGMGRVYLGYSPGGRAAAVKVVHPELARDPEFMARFQREAQAATAVSGAYTAPVLAAGPTDNPPWLATAYVPGPSLMELVARTGPLPDAAVWRLAGGLVEALQAIHGKGLVHRDLKPGNILLASDGPRVIDFGISRATAGTQVTAVRTTIGTPAFMSPEQVEAREVGPPSDVFALGSVLAYAATGTAPFDGGQSYSIFFKVVSAEPDLSRLTEGPYGPSGPGLRALVGACLAKDPARRPSLAQLITAIATASTAFPPVAPGAFWPSQVAAVIESRTTAARPPQGAPQGVATPPGQVTPRQSGPLAAVPGPVTPVSQGPVTPVRGLGHGQGHGQGHVTPARPGSVTGGQPAVPAARASTTRWIVLTGLAIAAAIAIGVVLALALMQNGSSSTGGSGSGSGSGGGSHADSVIATTVCSEPATGVCSQAGSSQVMEVQPKSIDVSADGSGYVSGLAWAGWGAGQATATGTLKVDNCNPNCAQGTYASYPATVTVAGLQSYGTGLLAYSTIVVQSPAANMDYTYSKDTVP